MSDLAKVIRGIRHRQGMTTTVFGELLGVSHSQISRYESGKAVPGALPLGRLLHLAEGAEKNPILKPLSEMLGRSGKATEAELIHDLEKMHYYPDPLWGSLPLPGPPADPSILSEIQEFTPYLAALTEAFNEFWERRREIDASLVRILRLWLLHDDTDPRVRQCFEDGAKYIEMALTTKAEGAPAASVEHKKSA